MVNEEIQAKIRKVKAENLTKLDLSVSQYWQSQNEHKKLTEIPSEVFELTQLQFLNLQGNNFTNIPESIGKLSNLTYLAVSNNQLTTLPESIGNLSNLTRLDLRSNQLSSLPESIGNLSNLTDIDLILNPLKTPPLETCQQGIEGIREYFRQAKEEGYDTIYEAKFIIVGEGEAGKTSLMNKIIDNTYSVPNSNLKATHGIDIKIFNFPLDKVPFFKGDLGGYKQFRVNIWDFGGQEIYHQTHQFFLTKRSLYALVTDSRKDHQHLDYWLQIVELLSENSPMLIIKNEKDCCVDIKDEAQIRTRFSAMVKEILDTNLATNAGLERIIARMQEYIQELPYVGIKIPKSWAKVRQAIKKAVEEDKIDYISLKEFLEICDDCGYTKDSRPDIQNKNEEGTKFPTFQDDGRLYLSQFLHDLGIILHFQDDQESLLYDTVILDPTWGTQAVYELLKKENNPVKNNLGKFTFTDLNTIWADERYKDKYRELLELMKRFKLCYQLPNLEPKTYIAPQLLDTNAPEYNWNKEDNLRLNYRYEFMPKGILSRFIVEMHDKIEEPKVWRYGVILSHENTRAEIIETYNSREILIRLAGKNKRDLLTIIWREFNKIYDNYKGLKVDMMIPCNCQTCKTNSEPHFFIYQKLKERLARNKMTIECQNPPYEDVKIRQLIDDTIGTIQPENFNETKQVTNVTVINQQHSGSGDNTRDKNNTNFPNAQFDGGFADRDYNGDVTNN